MEDSEEMVTGKALLKAVMCFSFSMAGALAEAEPIYLKCLITSEPGYRPFEVKLDEVTGKISHTKNDGSGFNADGVFSSSTVSYRHSALRPSGLLYNTEQYTIDRQSLKVTQLIKIISVDRKYRDIDKTLSGSGACEIIKVTNRKI